MTVGAVVVVSDGPAHHHNNNNSRADINISGSRTEHSERGGGGGLYVGRVESNASIASSDCQLCLNEDHHMKQQQQQQQKYRPVKETVMHIHNNHDHDSGSRESVVVDTDSVLPRTYRQSSRDVRKSSGSRQVGHVSSRRVDSRHISWGWSAHHTHVVALCLSWYASSALGNTTGKLVLVEVGQPLGFTYVQLVTSCALGALVGRLAHIDTHCNMNSHSGHTSHGMSALRSALHWTLYGLNSSNSSSSADNDVPLSGWRRMSGSLLLVPTRWSSLVPFVPLSCLVVLSHVLSSLALERVPLAYVHTIKALAPLFTVAISRLCLGKRYSTAVYLALLPLTIGVIMACTHPPHSTHATHATSIKSASESTTSLSTSSSPSLSTSLSQEHEHVGLVGWTVCVLATFVFVLQTLASKRLLGTSAKSLGKLSVLVYTHFICLLVMFPVYILFESPLHYLASFFSYRGITRLLWLLLANGLFHFTQALFAFSVLAITSPVTYSIASLIKRIVVIVTAVVWFGLPLTATQYVGILIAMAGVWWYQKAKS